VPVAYQNIMGTLDELRHRAHDLYARARSSIDPLTKRVLMTAADDYLKEAEKIRHSEVIKAEFPTSDRSWDKRRRQSR
jgi:hypothetical protein